MWYLEFDDFMEMYEFNSIDGALDFFDATKELSDESIKASIYCDEREKIEFVRYSKGISVLNINNELYYYNGDLSHFENRNLTYVEMELGNHKE